MSELKPQTFSILEVCGDIIFDGPLCFFSLDPSESSFSLNAGIQCLLPSQRRHVVIETLSDLHIGTDFATGTLLWLLVFIQIKHNIKDKIRFGVEPKKIDYSVT